MSRQFTLSNGAIFVIAEAPGDVYNSDQIRQICNVADEDSAFLKITEDHRLGFVVNPQKLPEIQQQLGQVGIVLRHYRSDSTASPKACLGELCPKFEQDALGDAIELSGALVKKYPTPKPFVSIGLNGCSEACIGSATDDIHIVGEESGYKIYLGGRARELPETGQFLTENITREQLANTIFKILDIFYLHREGEERIVDVCERMGTGIFTSAFEENLSDTTESESTEETLVENESEEFEMDSDIPESTAIAEDPVLAEEPEELSIDINEPLETEELQLDEEEIQLDDEKLQSDEEEIQIDNEELQIDDEDLTQVQPKGSPEDAMDFSSNEDLTEVAIDASSKVELAPIIETGHTGLEDREEDLELVEATEDDVVRITQEIRAENVGRAHKLNMSPPTPATESPKQSQTQNQTKTTSRFKLAVETDSLCITLPSGISCNVPFDWVSNEGGFEMEIGGQLLSVEHGKPGQLVVKYGSVSMIVPAPNQVAA